MSRRPSPLTDAEWRALARQTLITREEIGKTLDMMRDHVSLRTIDRGLRVDGQLNQLRSDLEDEMFKRGGPKDITIFFPGPGGPPSCGHEGIHTDALPPGATWRSRAVALFKREAGRVDP